MYFATTTHDYAYHYFYSGEFPKTVEVINKLRSDVDVVSGLIEIAKGKEKQKLEGVVEALEYTIELLEE